MGLQFCMQPTTLKIVKNMLSSSPLHEQGRCSSDAFWRPRVFLHQRAGLFLAPETVFAACHEALDNEVGQHYPKQSNVVIWAMTRAPDGCCSCTAGLIESAPSNFKSCFFMCKAIACVTRPGLVIQAKNTNRNTNKANRHDHEQQQQ